LKEIESSIPWNRVNVDMWGPLTLKSADGKEIRLLVLTMIDPATGWFEVEPLREATAAEAMIAFDSAWGCRYPRPQYIGYDGGSEYKQVFHDMCVNYGLDKKVITAYNPQSNGIVERVHQVIGDVIRTMNLENDEEFGEEDLRNVLQNCAFAVRASFHTTLGATPGQLVFGRDMVLPIAYEANWESIHERRQKLIQENNRRENLNRVAHEYRAGEKVLLKIPGIQRKLNQPREGPHRIEQVNANGTLVIRKGAIAQKVNIRRVVPYHE
jgi:transposase InsO family protein